MKRANPTVVRKRKLNPWHSFLSALPLKVRVFTLLIAGLLPFVIIPPFPLNVHSNCIWVYLAQIIFLFYILRPIVRLRVINKEELGNLFFISEKRYTSIPRRIVTYGEKVWVKRRENIHLYIAAGSPYELVLTKEVVDSENRTRATIHLKALCEPSFWRPNQVSAFMENWSTFPPIITEKDMVQSIADRVLVNTELRDGSGLLGDTLTSSNFSHMLPFIVSYLSFFALKMKEESEKSDLNMQVRLHLTGITYLVRKNELTQQEVLMVAR
ncbi:MAG: hypothetical protein NUV82_03125 [Candidatus Komeilibacteria bacterium]|nr:hypothetical protein [Candidatus Komeilibacteria bacterium]